MKRRHSREDAIDFCRRVIKARPEIIFGADFIAGFPTETPEMFENTLRIVEECQLTHLHVFPYSPRQGTPAARMPQVEKVLVKERAQQLRTLGEKKLSHYLHHCTGQQRSVLVERNARGHTEHFTPVKFETFDEKMDSLLGKIIPVTVLGVEGKNLIVKRND